MFTRDEWIKKVHCVHTVKYYAALERKEIETRAAKQVNLKDIKIRKIIQSQKQVPYDST